MLSILAVWLAVCLPLDRAALAADAWGQSVKAQVDRVKMNAAVASGAPGATPAGATVGDHFTKTSGVIKCAKDAECGMHGSCAKPDPSAAHSVCVCESPYINLIDGAQQSACVYEGVSRMSALVASGLGGFLGIDWFILSRGTNLSYIYTGLAKLSTLGGFGVWWAYDFARLASGIVTDGNGMPLFADM